MAMPRVTKPTMMMTKSPENYGDHGIADATAVVYVDFDVAVVDCDDDGDGYVYDDTKSDRNRNELEKRYSIHGEQQQRFR